MSRVSSFTGRGLAVAAGVLAMTAAASATGAGPLPTTSADFFLPGTQPDPTGLAVAPIQSSVNCISCHGNYNDPAQAQPWDTWVGSMMAESARDPVWRAAVEVANNDAAGAGESCIRCHAPGAFLAGRATGGDLSNLQESDLDGVSCHMCHRMVDPAGGPGSPAQDTAILAALAADGLSVSQPGGGSYVIDPQDARRGPFDDVPLNLHGVPILHSPFHQDSAMCGTCHDVSIPTFTRQNDGTYVLNALDQPHPTGDQHDMFPEQRTYSEWLKSDFADGGVVFADGRFGGALTSQVPNTIAVSSCQDCHMPDANGGGCGFWQSPPFFARPDLPSHSFAGANTWVAAAVLAEDTLGTSGLTPEIVADALALNEQMLRDASDMEVDQVDDVLVVRVINQSGHKLPTGYTEGRRMWLTVRFYDGDDTPIVTYGNYDDATATLSPDTKIYEARRGLDPTMAALAGLPAGHSFHLALNNRLLFDNRIPPRGFKNVEFAEVGAQPVGYVYDDGQHWDETYFQVPDCAARVEVGLYYQTTSREYIEFLRDSNGGTNAAGQAAYQAWVDQGRSAPVAMDLADVDLDPARPADIDGNGFVDIFDLIEVILSWGLCDEGVACPQDTDCDGDVDIDDLLAVFTAWGT